MTQVVSPFVVLRVTAASASQSLSWQTTIPDFAFTQGVPETKSIQPYLVNFNLATDTVTLTQGSLAGVTVTGAGLTLTYNGVAPIAANAVPAFRWTATRASTMTLSPLANVRIAAPLPPVPGAWNPARNAQGVIPSSEWQALQYRTWTRWANTNASTVLKPLFDSSGHTLYQLGSNKLDSIFDNFNGAAVKAGGTRAAFYGGGHEGGSTNAIVEFDVLTGMWRIIDYGTKVGVGGMTQEDYVLYADNARSANVGSIYIKPYSRSPTGFAAKVQNSFSFFGWLNCIGPERYSNNPNEVVYANGGTVSSYNSQIPNVQIAFPGDLYGAYDIFPDGKPTPRHTYAGFLYIDDNKLMNITRSTWFANRTTGWISRNNGGRVGQAKPVGELLWSILDGPNNRVLKGGCGSNCSGTVPAYYFYRQGVFIDTTTGAETDSPNLFPASIPQNVLNSGDTFNAAFVAGRRVGWASGTHMATYHLDTGAKVGYEFSAPTGIPMQEGQPSIYAPSLGGVLLFNSNTAKLACTFIATDTMAAPLPNGNIPVTPTVFPLANSVILPQVPLVYTRLWMLEAENVLIYASQFNNDLFVCRMF